MCYNTPMDDSEKLDRILKLTEENNRKIKALYRAQIWATVRSVIYWCLIIAIGVGSFYFIQPYLTAMNQLIGAVTGNENASFFNISPSSLKGLVN